jgi:hypothetical protein
VSNVTGGLLGPEIAQVEGRPSLKKIPRAAIIVFSTQCHVNHRFLTGISYLQKSTGYLYAYSKVKESELVEGLHERAKMIVDSRARVTCYREHLCNF